MNKMRFDLTQTVLLIAVITLLVANLFLFLRVDKLQQTIVEALRPCSLSTFSAGLPLKSQAPNFNLIDVYGASVRLTSFKGVSVLLMFSSTHCLACQQMYATLREFHSKYPEVFIVMISRGTEDENLSLITKEGLEFTILNWEDEVAKAYQISGTPYFYWIDGNGTIQNQGSASSIIELENLVGLEK